MGGCADRLARYAARPVCWAEGKVSSSPHRFATEEVMSNTDVRRIRAGLKHPIIDADGHWAEFHPHMRQEFKRIGGDIAVEAFDMATARIPKSLNMSVAERAASKDRPGSVLVPAHEEHARPGHRDDAAPALRAARRDRARLLRRLPDVRARLVPPAAGEASPRAGPRVQHVHGGPVPSLFRPDHSRRDHSDVLAGRGDRRAGVRVEAARAYACA